MPKVQCCNVQESSFRCFELCDVMDVTEREASVIMKMLEVEAATVTYSEQLTVGLDT